MGYLSINQINDKYINIHKSTNYYSIGYITNYLKLSSILFKIRGIQIIEHNGYYITIDDDKSILDLTILDTYLSNHIPNYKPLLYKQTIKIDSKEIKNYLYLKKNTYLRDFIDKLTLNEIYINIIKLKKTASHSFPIVYVL